MQLVGMLDSPFVRRVAVTMQFLGVQYEHRSLSVLGGYDEFRKVNPLAKVPTLVCDDGEMLVDSSLIIDHVERLAGRTLMPGGDEDCRRALQLIGVSLTTMEKVAQRIYELKMRPDEYQYAPWLERVTEQLNSALDWLEKAASGVEDDQWLFGADVSQADICIAIAWRFANHAAASEARPEARPALVAFGERAEVLPEFKACPLD
jgi:glutathione S-transferase